MLDAQFEQLQRQAVALLARDDAVALFGQAVVADLKRRTENRDWVEQDAVWIDELAWAL